MRKSNIIDIPRLPSQEDLFGIQTYQDALVSYIEMVDSPMTIALQGEWGSGKTSLMNQLRFNLCESTDAHFYSIWINTWQFSLMQDANSGIIAILEAIITQIADLNKDKQRWESSKKVIGTVFKRMATAGTRVAAEMVGLDGEAVAESIFSDEDKAQANISKLTDEIQKLLADLMAQDTSKKGVLFFIDDLDRIDPPVAVSLLELLKNIFELPHCIFVLAIDYGVVIKGLKPKFGELTPANEREFRSFFDKLIQLPFSMPVTSYKVDTFLIKALQDISFFTAEELQDESLTADLSHISELTVGANPRALKRLMNTLALISIINDEGKQESQQDSESSEEEDEDEAYNKNLLEKKLHFALVCIQISFPRIYNLLLREPNFKSWDERLAQKEKLPTLSSEEVSRLNEFGEFDETWEQVLYRFCQQETYLSQNAFNLSNLLNLIAENIDNDEILGTKMSSLLAMSSVTNIKAEEDSSSKSNGRTVRRYKYNGKTYAWKNRLIADFLQDYLSDYPKTTYAQLLKVFKGDELWEERFVTMDEYKRIRARKNPVYGIKRTLDQNVVLECSDQKVILNTNIWEYEHFINRANELGYKIKEV